MYSINKGDEKTLQKLNEKTTEQNSNVEQKASEILEGGYAIEFIMEQFSKIHVGDTELGKLLLLSIACQSCDNTEGLHVNCSGKSGKGKTDACRTMGLLLPDEYFISGSLTNKALLYMNLKSGSVVLNDDVDDFKDDMEQLIKSTISYYQAGYKHRYTDLKKQGSNKIGEVWIPSRTAFWFTSVHSSFDMQVLNRLIKIDVEDTPEQNRRILEHVLECAVTGKYGYSITSDVEVCRAIFRQLKENPPCSVVIPFAKQLEKIPQITRNLKMFLDLVMSSAVMNQFKREKSENGQIMANRDDFERAVGLWSKVHRAQTTGLTGEEQKVFDAIVAAGANGISNKDLETQCGLDKGSVWRAINGKKQSGSGEYKGGLKNKVVGLSCDNFCKVWVYEGIINDGENIVTLMDYPEISYSQLHQVAEPCNSKITV